MIGKTGGYKRIINPNNPTETEQRSITGQEVSRFVQYRFDFQPPVHCSETEAGCPSSGYVPVDFGEGGDIRRVSRSMVDETFSHLLSCPC